MREAFLRGSHASGRNVRMPAWLALIALIAAALSLKAIAPPPEPHGLAGWLFDADGVTQMPLNTSYSINDTNSSFYIENVTRVPFPNQTGRYSETVEGNDNDTVEVRAWNASHWGRTSVVLIGDMDNVNVSLNNTRPGEPNVTLLNPADGAVFAVNGSVAIQANLSIVGWYDAVRCNATVSFSSPGVITLMGGENATLFLGNLSPGSATLVNWSANASTPGTTDITVDVFCDPLGSWFNTRDNDTSVNVKVKDAVPPTPHGLAGYIYYADGVTQVALGTGYLIEDYDTGFLLRNVTRIPFPGYTGRYSETVEGVDGDTVNVSAWNATHWGFVSVTLAGDMDGVNLNLNLTRQSETNVTIIFPPDTEAVSRMRATNITALVQALGASAVNCSATVSIANESVLNLTAGENATKQLGNISLSSTATVSWNVTAEVGTTNVTVNASCLSDGKILEGLDADTILANITSPGLYLTSLVVDSPVSLLAGTTATVRCNATVFDENLAANISSVNATLWDAGASSFTAADDNNDHYTNASCSLISAGQYEANYTCSFAVWYYANNGSWLCNVTAFDNVTLISNFSSNSSTVNSLFSLTSDSVLDFGNMPPAAISGSDVSLNLTNTGNMPFNVSLYGYGIAIGDGTVMGCLSGGNFTVGDMRYSHLAGTPFPDLVNLTNTSTPVANFTLYQRTNDTAFDNDLNYTYWKLSVPYGTKGFCNGTVVLSATLA